MRRLTNACNEDEKMYLDQLHNRGRDIEQIQRDKIRDKQSASFKMAESANNQSKSTRNNTLDINKLSNFKNSNINLTKQSKYSTIKFVKNEEDRDSETEKDDLREKLKMEDDI